MLKMLYDKIRNKEKFIKYTKIPTKKEMSHPSPSKGTKTGMVELQKSLDSSFITESIESENPQHRNAEKFNKLVQELEKKYK